MRVSELLQHPREGAVEELPGPQRVDVKPLDVGKDVVEEAFTRER
jgi:hypothetical protein